ncbi:hypothetical protein LY76DRAFT_594689 [Colletotrichum caudatum]|nr:hypothetical protein LY76DRAFT_594689 [Colletotrichum caudatum]
MFLLRPFFLSCFCLSLFQRASSFIYHAVGKDVRLTNCHDNQTACTKRSSLQETFLLLMLVLLPPPPPQTPTTWAEGTGRADGRRAM